MSFSGAKDQFESDGYVVLRGLLPMETVAAVGRELDGWLSGNPSPDGKNLRFRFKNHLENGQMLLDAIDPIVDLFPSAAILARHSALTAALETLFGEPPCLFKDKVVLKSPRVAGYPLHQDYIAWPDFPGSFTTVVTPLDPATRENGCIEVYPGAHRRGLLAPADGDFHDLPETAVSAYQALALELSLGDVAIFGALTPHRSSPNRSSTCRRQLYLSFNRSGELGDYRERHYATYHQWLLRRYQEFGASGFYFK